MSEKSVNGAVWFGARLAGSQAFADLFRDGMALVEETAAYLDGPGRLTVARGLPSEWSGPNCRTA
ncbi:MAG: regulator of CtrA degradation [Alphaproteobacteria bacterium]|nr:regulator of CtrA degradation [Alphaproteobacteria bacterium]